MKTSGNTGDIEGTGALTEVALALWNSVPRGVLDGNDALHLYGNRSSRFVDVSGAAHGTLHSSETHLDVSEVRHEALKDF